MAQLPKDNEPIAGRDRTGKAWYQWFREIGQTLSRITPFAEDKTVKVGSGQRFTTINAALAFLSRRYPFYESGGIDVEIELQAGFTMAEQVIVDGVDLNWVTITSVDAEVTITASALTTTINDENQGGEDLDWRPAFAAINGGRLPVIGALFSMGASPDNDKTGIFLLNNGYAHVLPDCGIKNAKGRGVHCKGSVFVGTEANFYNSKRHAIYAESGSCVSAQAANLSRDPASTDDWGQVFIFTATIADLRYATCNDARGTDGAVFVRDASHAVLRNATINDSASRGIWAHRGCFVDCRQASISAPGTIGIFADYAAHVEGSEVTITNSGNNAVRCEQGGEIVIPGAVVTMNAAASALFAEEGGRIIIDSGSIVTTDVGCYAEQGGFVSANGATITGASMAVRVGAGGTISATDATLTGCTTNGARCTGGNLNVANSNCQMGGAPSSSDIGVFAGGVILAGNATGGTNVTPNTFTTNGMIINTDAPTASYLAEDIQDIVGAMFSGNTETGGSLVYQDSDGTIDFALDSEYVQDLVGAMFSSNTEYNVIVTYQDSDGTIDVELSDNPTITGTMTAGAFTANAGDILVDRSGDAASASVRVRGDAGQTRYAEFYTGSNLRWRMGANATAESGANAGSNFGLFSYDDAGAFLATVLSFVRSTGVGTFSAAPNIGSDTLAEYIADTVGAMVSSNTETSGLSVTYQDSDNTLDFTVDAANMRTTLGIVTGSYTPTLTNVTNLDASTASVTRYVRVSDIVIVFGNVAADATAAASTATELGMSLPVASAMTSFIQLGGMAGTHQATVTPIRILGDPTNDRASFQWASLTTANTNIAFIFAYVVL